MGKMNTLQTDFGDFRVKSNGDRHTVIWVDRYHNTTGGNGKSFATVEIAAAEAKRLHEERDAERKAWDDSYAEEKRKFHDLSLLTHKRKIKGHSDFRRFLDSHDMVGEIQQPYGHAKLIYRASDGLFCVVIGDVGSGASVRIVPESMLKDQRVNIFPQFSILTI